MGKKIKKDRSSAIDESNEIVVDSKESKSNSNA